MKYIYFIVVIFLLTGCTEQSEIKDYDYIPDNSIRFIRTDNETSILMNKNDLYYLLLLNKSNIDIEVNKKYFNLQNECIIECDLKSTYGMIGYLLNIPFGDLYYLFSEKQTITKEEILHRLIEEEVIKDIVLNNLKELR